MLVSTDTCAAGCQSLPAALRTAQSAAIEVTQRAILMLSPHNGDTLHQRGKICHGGVDQIFTLYLQRYGIGPQKLKILLKFFAFHNIYEICRVSTTFQGALAIKIWVDLLKGLRSYGGFKLRGTGFPQIFSAP